MLYRNLSSTSISRRNVRPSVVASVTLDNNGNRVSHRFDGDHDERKQSKDTLNSFPRQNKSNPRIHSNTAMPSSAKQNQEQEQRQQQQPVLLGTKATWLAITDVPPLATIDDVLREIQRVVTTELKRGILDLTKTEILMQESLITMNQSSSSSTLSSTTATIADAVDATTDDDLNLLKDINENIGIHISLQDDDEDNEKEEYGTSDDDDDDDEEEDNESVRHSMFPLWTPPLQTNTSIVPPHFVLEAQIMLSTLARPMGWYLRFPNRSVVQAILQHVQEAEKIRESFKKEQKRKRIIQRKKKLAIQTHQEDNTTTQQQNSLHLHVQGVEVDDHDPNNPPDEMDLFTWEYQTTRPLICAGKELSIAPFFFMEQISNQNDTSLSSSSNTNPFTVPPSPQEKPIISQPSYSSSSSSSSSLPTKKDVLSVPNMLTIPFYHQYKSLVDDTVIRVENCSNNSTVDDIRYFFRRFDLKQEEEKCIPSSTSSSSSSSIPAILSIEGPTTLSTHDIASSNITNDTHDMTTSSHSTSKTTTKSYAYESFKGDKKIHPSNLSTITPMKTKTFLVRFKTSAYARAAIRELQYAELLGRRVKLAQYSRQIPST